MIDKTLRLARQHQTMILSHRAMCRDIRVIAQTARALADAPNPPQVSYLAAYTRRLLELIEHHHQGEDEILWALARDNGAPEESLRLLTDEHEELVEKIHVVDRLAAELAQRSDSHSATASVLNQFAETVEAMHNLLSTHTADEERELAGPLTPVLPTDAWRAFGRHMVRTAPKWTLTFMPPWLDAVADASEKHGVPAPPVARIMRGPLRRKRKRAFGPLA
jgi:hemerythrin-like domain-containing protein